MKREHAPIGMGLLMGPMMLWMLHGQLAGDSASILGIAVFVGAHMVVLLLGLIASLYAARLSPAIRNWLDRLHRPSWQHVIKMLASAVFAALSIHIALHGIA